MGKGHSQEQLFFCFLYLFLKAEKGNFNYLKVLQAYNQQGYSQFKEMNGSRTKVIYILSILISIGFSLHAATQTVAIVCTNDFHGNVFPYQTFRSDTKQKYLYGGLEFMAQMVETVEQEYAGRVLYLDAGDQFQGGIESSSLVSSGQIVNDYFNEVKTDASTLGNHEFDFGPKFLFDFMQNRDQPSVFLSGNLRSQNGDANFLPNQQSSKLFQMANGIKIGVIGVTVTKTKQQMNKQFPHYDFLDYKNIIVEEAKKLREAGANAIVLLSHLGDNCSTNETFGIWKEDTKQEPECSGSMTQLMKQLPKGTVDAVVQGHIHVFSHRFIDGVPIAGTTSGGFYFNIIYLTFRHGRIFDKAIEGPIPVCEKVFQIQRTCGNLDDQRLAKAGPLVEWQFHGRTVTSHPRLKKRLEEKWWPLMKPFLDVIAFNEVNLETDFYKETPLANLILGLFVKAAESQGEHIDFAFINAGSFRWTWMPGDLQERHFLNMFPYDNNDIISFDMTGQQLLDTLKTVQTSSFYYPTHNLQETISIDENKKKKYINATFFNGDPIDPQKTYRGVTRAAVIVDCRDAFCDVVNKTYTVRNKREVGNFNQVIRGELRKLGTIPKEGLIDPLKPHMIVIKEATSL